MLPGSRQLPQAEPHGLRLGFPCLVKTPDDDVDKLPVHVQLGSDDVLSGRMRPDSALQPRVIPVRSPA